MCLWSIGPSAVDCNVTFEPPDDFYTYDVHTRTVQEPCSLTHCLGWWKDNSNIVSRDIFRAAHCQQTFACMHTTGDLEKENVTMWLIFFQFCDFFLLLNRILPLMYFPYMCPRIVRQQNLSCHIMPLGLSDIPLNAFNVYLNFVCPHVMRIAV